MKVEAARFSARISVRFHIRCGFAARDGPRAFPAVAMHGCRNFARRTRSFMAHVVAKMVPASQPFPAHGTAGNLFRTCPAAQGKSGFAAKAGNFDRPRTRRMRPRMTRSEAIVRASVGSFEETEAFAAVRCHTAFQSRVRRFPAEAFVGRRKVVMRMVAAGTSESGCGAARGRRTGGDGHRFLGPLGDAAEVEDGVAVVAGPGLVVR